MAGDPSAFVDKGSIVRRTALRSLIQSILQNNVVEVVCDTTSPGCYNHLFLEIPHFTMESEKVFGELSLETPGSLPSILWIPISTYPSTEVTEMSSISNSGHHIPIPGTAVWPFSSTLGIHQDYDRDQNAGTHDGHQSLSVPGRLAHLFTISRPVPLYKCSLSATRWASSFTTRS